MRVLLVHRDPNGDYGLYANSLADSLIEAGIDAVVDDSTEYVPQQTGWRHDRKASKWLKDAVRGFDLLHCLGYRMAWAAAEALYVGFPWVYSALDSPKTTNPLLIDRLNAAKRGLCATATIKNQLDLADALHLKTLWPSVPRFTSARIGLEQVVVDMARVPKSELEDWKGLQNLRQPESCKAYVVAGSRSYSYRAAVEMSHGTIVIAKSGSGMEDMIESDRSGILVSGASDARRAIDDLDSSPEFAKSLSEGASERAEQIGLHRHSFDRLLEEYESIRG